MGRKYKPKKRKLARTSGEQETIARLRSELEHCQRRSRSLEAQLDIAEKNGHVTVVYTDDLPAGSEAVRAVSLDVHKAGIQQITERARREANLSEVSRHMDILLQHVDSAALGYPAPLLRQSFIEMKIAALIGGVYVELGIAYDALGEPMPNEVKSIVMPRVDGIKNVVNGRERRSDSDYLRSVANTRPGLATVSEIAERIGTQGQVATPETVRYWEYGREYRFDANGERTCTWEVAAQNLWSDLYQRRDTHDDVDKQIYSELSKAKAKGWPSNSNPLQTAHNNYQRNHEKQIKII